MKKYSVICWYMAGGTMNVDGVIVYALNEEDAKVKAVEQLKSQGHKDAAYIGFSMPGCPSVMEIK